jgi:hypothetical protein
VPFCYKCGTARDEGAAFCAKCGAPVDASTANMPSNSSSAAGQAVAVAPRMAPADLQATAQMAMGAAALATHQRLATSTCPNCGTGMVAVYRRSTLGLVLICVGLLMTPIPVIGWIFGPIIFIVGLVLRFGGKGKLRYQCPGCNYSNR